MIKYQLRTWILSLCMLASLVIIADFLLPGRVFVEEVIEVKKERQQYYNAARNYHYSYKVFTHEHNFFISEDFAQFIQEHQAITYTVSPIFDEVNSYSLPSSGTKGIYSLRILSGLILPLLVIVAMGLAYKYEHKVSTFVFVLQILLIADLIFLIV